MEDEKYLRNIEAKRQNVISIVESDYGGNSQVLLPSIMVEFTAYELLEKYGMFEVIKLNQLIDVFLTGFGIGQRNTL